MASLSGARPVEMIRAVINASEQGPFTGGSFHDVIFDALDLNTAGGTPLNAATGVFTVPAGMAGTWDIRSQLYLFVMNPSAQYQMTIDINGSLAAKTMITADTSAHFFAAQHMAELAAGDTIQATVKAGGSYDLTKIDGNSAYSWIDFKYYPR